MCTCLYLADRAPTCHRPDLHRLPRIQSPAFLPAEVCDDVIDVSDDTTQCKAPSLQCQMSLLERGRKKNCSKVDGMNVGKSFVAFVVPHALSLKHADAPDTTTAVWKTTTNSVPSVFSLCFSHSPPHSIVDL